MFSDSKREARASGKAGWGSATMPDKPATGDLLGILFFSFYISTPMYFHSFVSFPSLLFLFLSSFPDTD